MVRFIVLCSALICLFTNSYSQQINKHQNDFWMFGNTDAMSFNTPNGEPKKIPGSNLISLEGTCSIADEYGNLLFYTDGVSIWDKNNSEMPNGYSLFGSRSSSNGAIIIPNPIKKNIYYVFTTGGAEDISPTYQMPRMGLNYSIVDMNLNNGNGDVILKNKNLYYPTTEKLTAVKNLLTNKIWVITHELDNNSFRSYEIDSNGVDTIPIISKTGVIHKVNPNDEFYTARGRLSASPNGTKIISAVNTFDRGLIGVFEIFDFNPNNGKVSNGQILDSFQLAYSCEFSPNGNFVYTKTARNIKQYNLTYKNINKIKSKVVELNDIYGSYFNAMLRATNGKIYIANEYQKFLSVIDEPNELGSNCKYIQKSFILDSNCYIGLPTFLNSYYDGTSNDSTYLEPILTIDYPRNVCFGDSIRCKIKVNYADKILIKVIDKYKPINNIIINNKVSDSTAEFLLPPVYVQNNLYELFVSKDTNYIDAAITESSFLYVNAQQCCGDNVYNGKLDTIPLIYICNPIGYSTDFDFRSSDNSACQLEFTNSGQMNCNYEAGFGNSYFFAQARNSSGIKSNFLYGDPIPNLPQRAWIQKNSTRLNTKYKFTAYVRNVENILRNGTDKGKNLKFWLGTKDRYSLDTIASINNVLYKQNWIELTGFFEAKDYETEFSVGVFGISENNQNSYGFGIDDISIIPLPEYKLELTKNHIINFGIQVKLDVKINTEVSVKWTPITGLDNPNILTPFANPSKSTMYYIEAIDKFGCIFNDSVYVEVNDLKPITTVTRPAKVCFGDSVNIKVKVNFTERFTGNVFTTFPNYKLIKYFTGKDSIVEILLPPFTDYNNSLKILVQSDTSKGKQLITDSLLFGINATQCCNNTIQNWSFNTTSTGGACNTVDYTTDFDFRSSSTSNCPSLFTALGQINSQAIAIYGNPNFEGSSINNNSNFLFGDPLINKPQRAWIQKNPTRLNTKYKFTAYVRNVEKITRNGNSNKNLGFWLGTKDNISSDTIIKIDNVLYNQGWLELTGFFTARENETELSVGVIATSSDNLSSYGFGIDEITLLPLPNYKLELTKNLLINFGEKVKLDAKINTEVNVKWTPITGLDNPNSLNPIANPSKSTMYYIEAIDKFGCKFNDSVFVEIKELKPITTITRPTKVCFGDSVNIKVKLNFTDKFTGSVFTSFPNYNLIKNFIGKDSIAEITLPPFTDYNNYLKVIVIDTKSPISDSVNFQINAKQCCNDVVDNGKFYAVASGGACFTVDYTTDFDFRSSNNSSCPGLFTALGQMNSQSQAYWGNPNFEAKTHSEPIYGAFFLYGDPLINKPQRAWFQKNPTRLNTKYKFTAYVRNVEKITRNGNSNKNLGFWLGTKDNISSDTIAKIDNVLYNQGWLELTGFFTARENETELSVGVIATSSDSLSSYGFGIDDITLIPLPDYSLDIVNMDTLICENDSIQINSKINTPVSIKWSPTTGLDNPNSLTPIAKPQIPTKYFLNVTDKYGCTFQDSLFVDLKSCSTPAYLCKPYLSIELSDTTLPVGEKFCLNGTILAKCDSLKLPETLFVKFSIPNKLFKVVSVSEQYSISTIDSLIILTVKFPSSKLTLGIEYLFNICLSSYLSDTLQSQFQAIDDTSKYILVVNDPSYITLTLCAANLRLLNYILIASYEYKIESDKLKLYLTTEEKGAYIFYLYDLTGNLIKRVDFNANLDKYKNDFVQEIDLTNIANGTYLLRMRTPSGKFVTKNIIILK